ncbi:hypothetical protein KJ657_04050 [Patescibacteria group bacterium]|nr:hypothetical protein [Patescibacteria group bacterium]MBU1016237.1 hypothetical protein [Patescibacteria group bacterium]
MKKSVSARGSILIWTLLLGLSLATVFFFFSQRLNAGAASQRETIEYQNARLFLESYVAYLQSLGTADLITLRDADGGEIDFEGITGTLTNEAEKITGVVDAGGNVSFSAQIPNPDNDNIKVEWDLCPQDATELLSINPVPAALIVSGGCGELAPYENASQTTHTSFSLTATAGPTNYRLTAIEGAILYDNKWQLDLELSLGFRKKLTTSLTFSPGP